MFKILKGYMRKNVDRKITQKERVGSTTRRQRSYCKCFYDKSVFPNYFKRVNRKFTNCKRALTGVKDSDKEKGTDDTFKAENYLRNPWIEAIGWSGTLAFGWSLAQNFHSFVRKRSLQDYVVSRPFEQSNLPQHLCPHFILKNILLSSVSAQPTNLLDVQSLLSTEKVSVPRTELPIFGPKTADETLNEASDGMKKVHNEAVGELENRQGLRCMSKQRYRKAVIHFAAGSALQNSSATFNLAQCYELGLGTRQNYEKAAKCYRAASDQGNASATYNLAVFYAHGIGGLKPDRSKALKLLKSAVALGEPNAKELLERYVLNKTRTAVKKENEMKPIVENKTDKEETWIAEVRSAFAALKLPIQTNPLTVLNDKFERDRKSNSISTDDGLASEYESSNSSIESCSNSSYRSESSGSFSQEGKTDDKSSSGESSASLCESHLKLNHISPKSIESSFGRPTPLLIKNYRLSKTSIANT